MDSALIDEIENFFGSYTKMTYKKGDMIIRAEDTPQGVFYLKKGNVRMFLVGETGGNLMLHIFKPHAFFPMMWVVNDIPNTYYYEAMTSVEVWRAPKEAVREFLKEHPDVVYDFSSRLLSGLSGILKRFEYFMAESAYMKTALLLVYLAKTFGVQKNGSVVLPVPVTHREISGWIGTTRETASLQIERLKTKDLIYYQKRQMVIPNLTALVEETQQKN